MPNPKNNNGLRIICEEDCIGEFFKFCPLNIQANSHKIFRIPSDVKDFLLNIFHKVQTKHPPLVIIPLCGLVNIFLGP